MAEIKSTLEMVMERAARMATEVADDTANDNTERKGMRLAASYLEGKESDLMQLLKEQAPEEQMAIRTGMAQTLLRNIVLPREDTISEQSLLSLKALGELSGMAADTVSTCSELKQILEQYNQHKIQVRQQLDESIRGQLKQKLQQQGQNIDDEMSINPTMHPQYNDEWARVVGDLNAQYNQALDQRKDMLRQRLGG